jgi:hypothetical protein
MKREADVTHNFQKYGSNATMAAVTKWTSWQHDSTQASDFLRNLVLIFEFSVAACTRVLSQVMHYAWGESLG